MSTVARQRHPSAAAAILPSTTAHKHKRRSTSRWAAMLPSPQTWALLISFLCLGAGLWLHFSSNGASRELATSTSPSLDSVYIEAQLREDRFCPPTERLTVVNDQQYLMRLLLCGNAVVEAQFLSFHAPSFTHTYVSAAAPLIAKLNDSLAPHSSVTPDAASLIRDFLVIDLHAGMIPLLYQSYFNLSNGDVMEQSADLPHIAQSFFDFNAARKLRVIEERVDRFLSRFLVASREQEDSSFGEQEMMISCANKLKHRYRFVTHVMAAQMRITTFSIVTQQSLRIIDRCLLSHEQGVLTLTIPVVYSDFAKALANVTALVGSSHSNVTASQRKIITTLQPLASAIDHTRVPLSILKTLRSVFAHVRAYSDGSSSIGYLTFFASQQPLNFTLDHPQLPPHLADVSSAIEDDASLAARYHQRMFAKILSSFQWDEEVAVKQSRSEPLLINDQSMATIASWQKSITLLHQLHHRNLFAPSFEAESRYAFSST